MSTEYYNSQWQMPNEANKSKQANYSLDFNGTDQYITLGSISSINTDFTVSGWINTTQTSLSGSAYRGWFSTGTFNNVGQFAISVSNSSSHGGVGFVNVWEENQLRIAGTSNVADGNWHHIVLVKTSAQLEIYVDGSLQNTASNTTTFTFPTAYIGIGAGGAGAGNQGKWDGKISQVCVFNYALSASQVTTLWGGGTSVSNPMSLSPAPIAYYPLSNSVWNGSNYITPNNAVQDYVFSFNGNNNYINLGDLSNIGVSNASAASVSLWFKKDGDGNYVLFQLKDGSSVIALQSNYSNKLYVYINNVSYNVAVTVANNEWHNIMLVFDGTGSGNADRLKLYFNGSNITGGTYSGTVPTAVGTFTSSMTSDIGRTPATAYFDGELSNVQIFNTALSLADVETLYNNGSPIRTLASISQSSNLKAWYKLDASEVYNVTSGEWEVYNNAGYEKTYSFNGSNNIQIPNDSSIQPTDWTIGFWVKGFGQNGTYLFNNSPNGWNIKSSGNDIIISIGTYQSTAHRTATNALNGKWNYIVFSYSGTTVRGSLNGGYLNYTSAPGQTYDSSNLFIGSYSDGTNGFVGEIGQILFWNTRKDNAEGWNSTTQKPITSLPTPQSGPSPGNDTGTANLVSWWKLDAATITDSFGSNTGINNGAILSDTIIGRPTVIGDGDSSGMSRSNLVQSDLSRVFNKRTLAFHGGFISTARYATTQSGLLNPSGSSFSLSIWFRNVSSGHGGILSKKDGAGSGAFPPTSFGMFKDNSSASYSGISAYAEKLVFVFADAQGSYTASDSIGSAETIQTSKWYNVVVTHTPGDTKMYLNGSVDSTSTSINKSSFPDGYFTLSGCFTNGLNWKGALSNLSFFDTVLSATEVREIWNNGLPGDLNQHSKVDQLKDWIGIGSNYSGFSNSRTCLINYKKAPNMYGDIGALYGSTWNTIGTTGFGDFTGTSSGFTAPSATVTNIVTNAPYSDKNAVSVGMWNQYSSSQPNATITSGISDSTPQST